MQAQKTVQKNAPFAAPGVEPELLCAVPRRVKVSSKMYSRRLRFANFVIGLALFAYYFAVAPALQGWRDISWLCTVANICTAIVWLACEIKTAQSNSLLRAGYAVRATITGYDTETLVSDGYTRVPYRYTNRKGQSKTETLIVDHADCAKHDFAVGASFTLLFAPDDPYSPVPYFRVTEAMIPGAPPPKIAPP